MDKKKFVVRCDRAGVFYGEIKERRGSEVDMVNVRRLWFWSGAASLSQLAVEGVKNPESCKFTIPVREMTILGVIEIIPASLKACECIDKIKAWRNI